MNSSNVPKSAEFPALQPTTGLQQRALAPCFAVQLASSPLQQTFHCHVLFSSPSLSSQLHFSPLYLRLFFALVIPRSCGAPYRLTAVGSVVPFRKLSVPFCLLICDSSLPSFPLLPPSHPFLPLTIMADYDNDNGRYAGKSLHLCDASVF